MNMKKFFIEAFGWYGTIAIMLAYALNSFSVVASDSLVYQVLNGTGAVGIVLVSYIKGAYQPAALNAVWTVIAVAAIVKMFI